MPRKNIKEKSSMYEGKRLSLVRLALALCLVAALGYGGFRAMQHRVEERSSSSATNSTLWFGSYVDVTSTPLFHFEQLDSEVNKNVVLSFIVADKSQPCEPSWGSSYSLDQAATDLDLDRRIARLRQNNMSLAVSFGGLLNDELATVCKDPAQLEAAYKKVIDRYKIDTIDLDLENNGLNDSEAAVRRAVALAKIQADMRQDGKNLAVWLTLPVAPQGLTINGTNAIKTMLENKVDITGVNLMTFDYGNSQAKNQSLVDASKSALTETQRQLRIIYGQVGISLSEKTVWSKIGMTVMIGQTDDVDQVLGLEDAVELNSFAQASGVSRISMWSANRDVMCGENYVDVKRVSDSCSGIKQERGDFAKRLSQNFSGSLQNSAGLVTTSETIEPGQEVVDDPANSPYPIWDEDTAYPQGTKIVWRRNVYEAKWWNQNEVPDNPVLQAWETPWLLIGPVLPGEEPVKNLTLPDGTYPEWSGEVIYSESDRVMFEGVPYQAKWWNHGESPKAASSSPASSPWVALKQQEIIEIINSLGL